MLNLNQNYILLCLKYLFIFTDDDIESYDSGSDIDDEEAEVNYFLYFMFFVKIVWVINSTRIIKI